MTLVSQPGKALEFVAKGSKRHQAILKTYDTEINTTYTAVDEISWPELDLPESKLLAMLQHLFKVPFKVPPTLS